jgi:hypothetical protein
MARFNEVLAGRYNRFLQKLFVLKGGPPSPQLASEISTAIVFFNGVENRYLEGWNIFGFGQTLNGAVGNPAMIQLRNPSASNVVAVVESLVLSTTAADSISISLGTFASNLGAVLNTSIIDIRGGQIAVTGSNLTLSQSNSTAGGGLGRNFFFLTQAAVPFQVIQNENQEIPILPGATWRVETIAASNALTYGIRWRERLLEESERF